MARKKPGSNASNWDKLEGRDHSETLANRNVFEDQQLDRGQLGRPESKNRITVIATVVAVLVFLFAWLVLSVVQVGASKISDMTSGQSTSQTAGKKYYEESTMSRNGTKTTCYVPLDQNGDPTIEVSGPLGFPKDMKDCITDPKQIEQPEWAKPKVTEDGKPAEKTGPMGLGEAMFSFALWKLIVSLLAALGAAGTLYQVLLRQLEAQNLMKDTSDINQYANDQHIALPEEIQRKFDWFPNAGAHASPQVSSMISHVMVSNKGLKKVQLSERAPKDVVDEDGDVMVYEGEVLTDDSGAVRSKTVPLMDEGFGQALFDASGLPQDKTLRKFYDVTKVPYNPDGSDREKIGKYATVADMINDDWELPWYEPQRPSGAYLVDTAPVNTMVLAITRAGKGQTVIEPTLDMWMREKNPNNAVVNDPKGELLVKNYVRATMRGFQVVQFNLINAMKTDIYNPLGMAAEAAREGDSTKCALYVENIADVFFPTDGGEDPVWPNAANNAFKRAAYGLIDYYLEEERELREAAAKTDMDPSVLETKLDEMWGKVTLYNCYQLFVQLTSKKMKNPVAELAARIKAGEFNMPDGEIDPEADELMAAAQAREFLWDGKPETDLLSLYFTATEHLPENSMRKLIANANNALKAMAGAEKMLASVYGIAITAMSFFTDPTISTLTSGTPSQNTDLGGLSFPRRMGVRFGMNYLKRDHLIGAQAQWEAFGDPMFKENLGKDFYHEDIVSREGWARYYFKGKFPENEAWLRLKLVNPQTKMLIRTFYFHFKKDYQATLNGRHYITDPITDKKIVKNGLLTEVRPFKDSEGNLGGFRPGHTTYPQMKLTEVTTGSPKKIKGRANAIISTMVRYSEQPKIVFLVTPPHLMKYAKLILILVKQLVDLNFDKSYMTKSNQKPLYKTRFMLDELGNLQSEGHGIAGFETMLSIGLGQEQQFTLILQTLQQLRDVYGESVDKIVQGNCLPLDAPILTPSGWTTMGEIQPGDELLTPFGDVTRVSDKYEVKTRPVFEVKLRDGSSSEACPDHLWPVERWVSRLSYTGERDEKGRRLYVGTGPGGKTMERIVETISTAELKARVDKGRQVDLIPIEPVMFPEKALLVDPYVLGAILGDGHINEEGEATFYTSDPEIVQEIERRGYEVARYEVAEGLCPKYHVKGVRADLRELGIAGKRAWEKSVPESYLFGSVQQRIDLLRGLMDTDGTVSRKGEMEFTSSSVQLAQDVQTLVRSLGGRVSINVKTDVHYTSPQQSEKIPARDAYRVQNIRLPKINPFLLERKADRWRDRTRGFNRVVSVEYVREDEVQCIRVEDERHLYITRDFMPTHNTSNIVFLKSTDDSMIETLQKMSGTTHRSYVDSKTVTQDKERLIKGFNVEGKVSYTMSTREEPVIKYNDMAFISERNSIIFRAGDPPVWNRNETILPMSWRLFKDTIIHPGHEYSLQTIPTLSSALDFDVRQNQPNFSTMLAKRMSQAERAAQAKEIYQESYGYSDFDVERLDPDVYSDEVMSLVGSITWEELGKNPDEVAEVLDPDAWDDMDGMFISDDMYEPNVEVVEEVAKAEMNDAERKVMRFAGGTVSVEMLVGRDNSANHALEKTIVGAYQATKTYLEKDVDNFSVRGTSLCGRDGTVFISRTDESEALRAANEAARDPEANAFSEGDISPEELNELGTFTVHDAFFQYLAGLDSWATLGNGSFDREMMQRMNAA